MTSIINTNSMFTMPALTSQDDVCPNCKSDRYLNPNMVLLVSNCFHKMCESCVERLFGISSAPCPICQTTLRKNQFNTLTFEDLTVEKEVKIRKDLADIYNKCEEDFKSLREWDDYLEGIEDIIFNLYHDIDVDETKMKIKEYKQANLDLIKFNIQRKKKEDQAYKISMEMQKKAHLKRNTEYLESMNEEEREKQKLEDSLIDDLKNSKESADTVVKKHLEQALKKQRIGFEDRVIPANRRGMNLTYSQQRKLEQEEERVGLYDPIKEFVSPDVTQPEFRKEYKDPLWQINNDITLVAKAGGYFLRDAHFKAIKSIHFGLLEPLKFE